MATDFRALLQDTSETVERPKALPECWLLGKIGGHSFRNSRAKQTPFCRFTLHPSGDLHPQYATDELRKIIASLGEETGTKPLTEREFDVDAWLTPNSKYRLSDFLDRVVGTPNRSLEARIPETQGRTVMFKITPRIDEAGKETGFNDVKIDDIHPFSFGS
jgi:hypothetical protein